MSIGRSRCWITAAASCQVACGLVLWTLAGIEMWLKVGGLCKDYNTGTVVTGFLHIAAGVVGITLVSVFCSGRVFPRSKELASLVTYIVLSGSAVIPLLIHGQMSYCGDSILGVTDSRLLVVFIFKLVITYIGLLIAILGIGFASYRLCFFKNVDHLKSTIQNNQTQENATSPQSGTNKRHSSKPTLQLPEAKTHIQEAPGTNERITVVTLPEADGIVYAVPEESYIVKRGEATYITPPGPNRWTKFFPTYKKMDVD